MNRPTIFIFHGTIGSPVENWLPWLKQELETSECTVIIPHFPTPGHQSLDEWLKVMDPLRNQLTPNSIIVGHSLGATFALALLEHYSIQAAFFVAGFIDKLGNSEFDRLNKTFIEHPFAWEDIKTHCTHFELFQSDNDPHVPLIQAEILAKKLQTNLTLVPQAGHFNSESGYNSFPLLLEHIKAVLS